MTRRYAEACRLRLRMSSESTADISSEAAIFPGGPPVDGPGEHRHAPAFGKRGQAGTHVLRPVAIQEDPSGRPARRPRAALADG